MYVHVGKLRLAISLVFVMGGLAPSSLLVAQDQPIVFRGATVINGLGDLPTPNAVVVIEGETIQSVGGQGTNYPANATVLDVSGKFIIPGLVESHAHYEEWMGELFLNHGVTSILAVAGNFGKKKETSHNHNSRTPRIYDTAGDPRISPVMGEEQVREAVRQWLKEKPDFARLRDYNERSSQTYQWAAEEMHRAGLMVFGHTENATGSIRAGQDVVEHIWGLVIPRMSPKEHEEFQQGRYLHWSTFLRDWAKLEQMIQETVQRGAYLNPTLTYELGSLSTHAAKHEQEIYELNSDPFLRGYYPQNIAQSLLQKQRQIRNFSGKYENLVLLSRLTPEERQEFQRGYQLVQQFLKRFVLAGGKIQAGTDTISGGVPGLSLHQEMELLVEAGLTPLQALESATSWSADTLAGKNGARGKPKVGRIEKGAFADLVVLAADPLQEISNTRKIERVMKGGKFVELGYETAYISLTQPARKIAMATPMPEISSIRPHTVLEGVAEFEMVVTGVGFAGNSVVRVGGISVPTTFVNPRTLKAKIPADLVPRATPNPFDAPGPAQESGVFGDPTVSVSVFNPPPEGGTSNSISLRIRAQWMGLEDDVLQRLP